VEDGCVVQGCVVGPRAVIGAGTSLRECQVAAEYEVDEGEDFRGETLAEKTR
jgi:translation initiation factor eIF-2B subunit gamma